jgi:lactoylglutathione lyase
MELGAFSISLAVKDIQASKAFYDKLGFKAFWEIFRRTG